MLTVRAAVTTSERSIQRPQLNLRSIAKGNGVSPLPLNKVESLAASLAERTERYARSEVRQSFPMREPTASNCMSCELTGHLRR